MDQSLLVKIKWKTFLEDEIPNDGFTGPLVQSSMKISGKRGEKHEDYEPEFPSSSPLLFIVIYKLLLNHSTILDKYLNSFADDNPAFLHA